MENLDKRSVSVRLLIVCDQPRVRQSLEAWLTALCWSTEDGATLAIQFVGEAADSQQVVEQIQALHPDVVMLDLPTQASVHRGLRSKATLDGLDTIRTIKRRWPDVRVVVLTMYATDRAAILLAGADAFLLKGCSTRDLLDAVLPVAH
ncbi:MAG: response regulator transcription factor [Caldilineaceae bacterium]|jgi:DNA-binding NarL/FixJ family response regulator|nr:response regulator transcription factor [Caldilineaceae bacterium]